MSMNINLRQMRAFVSVAQLGSFTKAANAIHTTQPALSAQISQFEEALGVRLFDRNTRSVSLTQAGREMLPVIDGILNEIAGVITRAKDIAQLNTGRVTIAALPTMASTLLPGAIAEFRRRYPGISVMLKDALGERIVQLVRAKEVDFGISASALNDEQIAFTPVGRDHMVAVLPRDHPLAKARGLRLDRLSSAPLILMNRDSSVRKLVDEAFASLGHMVTPAFEAAFMSTAVGMVRAGLGVALLPSSAPEISGAADIVCRPLHNPKIIREIGILSLRGQSFSPAAESFVATLRGVGKTLGASGR